MNDLIIIYKGAHSNTLYTAIFDGIKWHGNDKISNDPGGISPESNYNPGTTVFNNLLYIIYKEAHSNTLYLSWYDGNKWYGNIKISDMNGGISPESNYCPNIVVYKGLLYTVYKDAHTNTLYVASFDGKTWYGNTKISDINGGISPESNYNPGMVVFNNKLYIIYKGAHSNTLYTAFYDGDKWSGNTSIKDQSGNISPESNYNPGTVVFNNKLYLVYKESHSNTLYSAWYDGHVWAGNTKIKDQGGNIDTQSNYCPNVEVYNNNLYIVYKEANSNTLYSAWYDGHVWAGNTKIKDQGGNIDPESNYNPSMLVTAFEPTSNSDWMQHLSDTIPISEINIPGCHDAAAINTSISTPYACHNHSISYQLEYGIRLLDVRLQISQDGSIFNFKTCHGNWGSQININTYQTLSSLLDECKTFLDSHSGEVILMSLKVDDWSNTTNQPSALSALDILLKGYPTTYQTSIPTLGNVRGKIFLYNRINNSLNLGVPISWSDNTNGDYAAVSTNRSYKVYVQDQYKDLPTFGAKGVKLEQVKNAFLKKEEGEIVWNFASATWYSVLGVYIMGDLLDYFGENTALNRLQTFGWTLFDFPFKNYNTDTYGAMNIVQLIISSNANPRYAAYQENYKVINDGHD
ncbi:MAG: hypothetical protein M0P33_05810 [Massilibacteroides sp.]|nr:hypothetical protein [Massilibacteroides sp.]